MEKYRKLKIGKSAAGLMAAVVLAGILSGCDKGPKFQDLTLEVGAPSLMIDQFLTEGSTAEGAVFLTDIGLIDMNTPGEHALVLSDGKQEQTVTLTILDTNAPIVQFVPERVVRAGESLDARDFLQSAADFTPVTVQFQQEPQIPEDYSDITVIVDVTDTSGNVTSSECTVSFQWMLESLTWELGKPITKKDILMDAELDGHRIDQADLDKINESGVGTFSLPVKAGSSSVNCEITVQDTQGPALELHFVHIWPQEYVTVKDFIVSVEDPSGVASTELLTELDTLTKGERPVKIKVTDALGNETVGETFIKVNLDHSAPVIEGMEDITTEHGVEPDYIAGVTASDNLDGALEFTCDASKVNVNEAGIYFVNYLAVDAAGNETTVRRRVIVPPREEDIQALVEEVAAELSDDPKEIRDFVWHKVRYSASWGEPHPVWHGFSTWSGNCYVHAYCLQALLDAKGYETQLIWTKDKSHYWVLVNLESLGMGWRHMDATPSAQHVRILYMTDYQRHENLDGRNWDRTAWPKAE